MPSSVGAARMAAGTGPMSAPLPRGVPFLFTTGYDGSAIPERFRDVMRCEKPIGIRLITQAIGRVVRA